MRPHSAHKVSASRNVSAECYVRRLQLSRRLHAATAVVLDVGAGLQHASLVSGCTAGAGGGGVSSRGPSGMHGVVSKGEDSVPSLCEG